MMMITLIQYYV